MLKALAEKMFSIADRVLKEAAERDSGDRFKGAILFGVALTRWARGLRKEARAYFNYIGLRALAGDDFVTSYEDGSYYEMLENPDYAAYLKSSVDLVLHAAPGREDAVCDIGCGRGFLVRELRRAGYTGALGIENSSWAVEHRVTPEVYLKKPSDFPDGHFRVVSLISVLEHPRKEDVPGFVRELARICSDTVVSCIPLYPNNLLNFFVNGADHLVFERRDWWDAEFRKAGFVPGYLPAGPTPFIHPFVYRKKRSGLENVWSAARRNLVRMRMGIGDQLCALPAIEEAKRLLPGLRICVSADSYHLEIFRGNPAFEAVGAPAEPGDNIVEFHYAAGFERHLVDDFAEQAGVPALRERAPKLYLAPEERYPLKRGAGPCLAVDTRANWVSRKWPHERFEETCRILKRDYGFTIVEVGMNQPYDTAAPEPEYLAAADLCYADRLSLRQTASVISQCDAFFGSDSGLSHVAAAVGGKAFTIFGPVDARYREHPGRTVPVYDGECYGCFSSGGISLYEIARRCPRGHHKCMRKVTPEQAAAAIAEGLGLKRPGAAR